MIQKVWKDFLRFLLKAQILLILNHKKTKSKNIYFSERQIH